ncbi:MAG: type II toxin-antitoxin system HicB family antitoxin [Eubacteriales bacterium]
MRTAIPSVFGAFVNKPRKNGIICKRIRRLTEEEGSGWLAEIPQLPGCMSDGETVEEAIANISDAKKCWIETALELGRVIPEPSPDDIIYPVESDTKSNHQSKTS